jgi:cytochrome c oxidase accessory protein FixG
MDTLVKKDPGGYYVAEQKVYPRGVKGRFARLRTISMFALLGLFYAMPWVQWNGRQAVLFDLPARKFYVFGLVMWPQDFIYLTALLIIAALSLFFFTTLAGRLWCGYACPQTVWTEAFLWMERIAEGDRNERMKLDRAPWSVRKVSRKALKHVLWLTFSMWTGITFAGYFSPIGSMFAGAATFTLGRWETFWSLFYGFATYGNAGFLREQVCKYMCPYARFQSAMFDRDTLIITYDTVRGEPRGPRGRGTPEEPGKIGACIDCTWCVQVCPTGIDIRKGLQNECIACAACIDACDEVMDKVGSPRGLIRYTTQNSFDHKPTRVIRPRVLIYGTMLTALIGAFAVSLVLRTPLAIDVIRDRNALYRLLDDGQVENVYNLKIMNKSERRHRVAISVRGPGELTLDPAAAVFDVASEDVLPVVIRVRRPAYEPVGSEDIEFSVQAQDAPRIRASSTARFLAPSQ